MQSANLSVIISVSSVVGCLVLGFFVEKTKKFKIAISISSIVGLVFYGAFMGVLYANNFAILAIVTGVLAFVLSPSGPLALEFGCELTFPVGEALSGGAILSVIQIFCPAQVQKYSKIVAFNQFSIRHLPSAQLWEWKTKRKLLFIQS